LLASNFRQTETLSQYLMREGTVAIANIDTRKLTRLLRSQGAQNGAISAWRPASRRHAQALIARPLPQPGPRHHGRAWTWRGGDARRHTYDWTRPSGSWVRATASRTVAALSCGGLRLRRQEEHPAHAGRARLHGHRGAGADLGRRGAGAEPRRRVPVQRPGRPGAVRLRHRRHAPN
jgi:hypothetical protein